MNINCPGCKKLADDLGLSIEEAQDIMLNSKILGNMDTLRYQIQPELAKHRLSFDVVYKKVLEHKHDCVYYTLLS